MENSTENSGNSNIIKKKEIVVTTPYYLIKQFYEDDYHYYKSRRGIRAFMVRHADFFWLYDKLGRKVCLDDYITWFSKSPKDDTKLIQHLGRINYFNVYNGACTVKLIKSKEYIQYWENIGHQFGKEGNLFEIDNSNIDLKRSTSDFGYYLISRYIFSEYPHIS